ncbi:MAG: hypothetical protein IJR83_03850 [Clostridia bacterium]|nr:hypothetical protein [Clostridia bacterium]
MNKTYIKSIIVIVSICLIMGLLLAGVYSVTAPVIAANEEAALNKALKDMFPQATTFEEADLAGAPKSITALYLVDGGSYYVVNLKMVTGYTTGATTFIMGVDASDMSITDLQILSYNESVRMDDAFPGSFPGLTADKVDLVTTASPAVFSKAALKKTVLSALDYLRDYSVKGGE